MSWWRKSRFPDLKFPGIKLLQSTENNFIFYDKNHLAKQLIGLCLQVFLHKCTSSKYIRIACICTLGFMICWGAILVLAPIKPFWTDEWRLIYNIKFKSSSELWGPLEYTQQFPRVYLQFIKAITSHFDYSYFILRFPSFLIGTATIVFGYRLLNKIYTPDSRTRYLFILLIISSFTFTEYFVQVKQYTMDIFLSLLAIWQLLELIKIDYGRFHIKWRYVFLCCSFLAAPYFSYTYPIAVSPVLILAFFRGLRLLKSNGDIKQKMGILFLQWFPLIIASLSIIVFYQIDVSGLMKDKEMYGYWNYRTISSGTGITNSIVKIWDFFAHVGSGLIFEIIIGVLGICAVLRNVLWWIISRSKPKFDTNDILRSYSVLLIAITIVLFITGKLPVEPKFNLFALPSIAICIIFFLDDLLESASLKKFTLVTITVLYLGLIGNIFTTAINLFLLPEYSKRMKIFAATENAIIQAQKRNLPIIVTPEVAYPDNIMEHVQSLTLIPPAAVLKGFPAYEVSRNLPVYSAINFNEINQIIKQLSPADKAVIVGDGLLYRVVSLPEY